MELTDKQRIVLEALLQGLTPVEAQRATGMTKSAWANHLRLLKKKLCVVETAHVLSAARREGLVPKTD